MGVLETFSPASGTSFVQSPTHFLGRALDTAAVSTDLVRVTLDSAANGISVFGPCLWAPRIREDGFVLLPARGDRVSVAFDEDGTPLIVEWEPSAASTAIEISAGGGGSGVETVVSVNANTTITNADTCVIANASVTVTLPASPVSGQSHTVKDMTGTASSAAITVAGNGHTIDGASSFQININYQSIRVIYTGSQWAII